MSCVMVSPNHNGIHPSLTLPFRVLDQFPNYFLYLQLQNQSILQIAHVSGLPNKLFGFLRPELLSPQQYFSSSTLQVLMEMNQNM